MVSALGKYSIMHRYRCVVVYAYSKSFIATSTSRACSNVCVFVRILLLLVLDLARMYVILFVLLAYQHVGECAHFVLLLLAYYR